MKKILLLHLFVFLIICIYSKAQPTIQWQKCLGGTSPDAATSIRQTYDSGYILSGGSLSINGDVTGHHGDTLRADYWIVKLSSLGAIQWQKSLGGTDEDDGHSIIQTHDSGYIVCGYSNSTDGDVTDHHIYAFNFDYWIVKLAASGDIQWSKSLGGDSDEYAYSIVQTYDNGYIVAGESNSNSGDVTGNHGLSDFWVVKLSSTGAIQWQKSLGGTEPDYARYVIQTSDSGYIVAGTTGSNDGDVTGMHGWYDFWVVKLSSTGAIQWQKCYGGSRDDEATSIIQTTDGGYMVSGFSNSIDGDVTANHGDYDVWVVKISSNGTIQWQKSLGGSLMDYATSVWQTTDSDFVIACGTYSNDGDVTGNHGYSDYWIVKLSVTGSLLWQNVMEAVMKMM